MNMADEDRRLQEITKWRKSKKKNRVTKLGDTVKELMDNQISPRQEKFGTVVETWNEMLPVGLAEHCRVDSILNSQLKVLVDSPVFVHELRLCSPQLLEQLQQRCPRARIKNIKIIIG
ncbi:MAG: DUF721 domain-containing protein [Planctomycetes bacterium]|nr:DUF721 domain-containing protein [Planctomycetota bacterium]